MSVKNESELRKLSKKLQLGGVKHVLIEEVDYPFTGQATAIGIQPTRERNKVRKYLSNLPLYGKEVKSEKQQCLNGGSDPPSDASLEAVIKRAKELAKPFKITKEDAKKIIEGVVNKE